MPETNGRRRRRRLTPIALAAGVLGSAVLGLGATGTYSSLTATITNSANTAGTGTLVMRQTTDDSSMTTLCSSDQGSGNSATCTTPNAYGGSSALTPGGAASESTMRIYDTGTLDPGAFTLAPGSCTSSPDPSVTGANNICTQLQLTLTCTVVTGGTTGSALSIYNAVPLSTVASGGVKDLKALGCLPLKSGSNYAQLHFSVQLASGAGNGVQGQTATQQLVWQFTTGS